MAETARGGKVHLWLHTFDGRPGGGAGERAYDRSYGGANAADDERQASGAAQVCRFGATDDARAGKGPICSRGRTEGGGCGGARSGAVMIERRRSCCICSADICIGSQHEICRESESVRYGVQKIDIEHAPRRTRISTESHAPLLSLTQKITLTSRSLTSVISPLTTLRS